MPTRNIKVQPPVYHERRNDNHIRAFGFRERPRGTAEDSLPTCWPSTVPRRGVSHIVGCNMLTRAATKQVFSDTSVILRPSAAGYLGLCWHPGGLASKIPRAGLPKRDPPRRAELLRLLSLPPSVASGLRLPIDQAQVRDQARNCLSLCRRGEGADRHARTAGEGRCLLDWPCGLHERQIGLPGQRAGMHRATTIQR